MRITLSLVPAKNSHRETAAWLVPGCDVRTWLNELEQWEIPLESLELRPIPRSVNDSTLWAVLVTCGPNENQPGHDNRPMSQQRIPLNRRPYACIARRVFVPIDADLAPEISVEELSSLLPSDSSEFVWHPSAGLIRIEPHERFGFVDLFVAPTERAAVWDRAVTGVSFQSRVISIEAEAPLNAEEVLKQAAPDIGSQNSALDELPPTPDEWLGGALNRYTKSIRDTLRNLKKHFASKKTPDTRIPPNEGKLAPDQGSGPMSKWGQAAMGYVAGAASLLGRGLGIALSPAGAAVEKMMKQVASISFIDQMARNREIDRLMHLLKTDPDAGLRFALPMGSGDGSRGLANPANQLVSRDTGFQLSRLGSGNGPADIWDIPPDQQYKLIQQYRELAAREIRLGRYRRAAYIHAELLGDLVSAALALESGLHFREAAVLYRDRLKRPVEAAKCLERAGLLDDAAEIYVEQGLFEQAGELYIRLDRRDEAERILRSWVEQLIENGDLKTASRILHDKLNDVDGALVALARGWPSSSSALWCLEESFVMLGLHSRHEAALNLIATLPATSVNVATTKLLARGLSGVTIDYPEKSVRSAAADATIVVVGKELSRANPSEAMELLGAVRRLAPHDRLLSRDCDRYVRQRTEPRPLKVKRNVSSRGISLVKRFSMSLENVEWRIAKSVGKSVYVAGFQNRSLVAQRLYWENLSQQNHRAFWYSVSDARTLILEPFPGDAGNLILHPVGADPLNLRGLPTDRGTMSMAGSPSWATKSTVAICYAQGGFGWRIREIFGTLEIACIGPKGDPLSTKDLAVPFDSTQLDAAKVTLIAFNKRLRIGVGPHLCRPQMEWSDFDEFWPIAHTTFDAEICCLMGTQIDRHGWLVALFETGGRLILDEDVDVCFPVAEDLESPCMTFLMDGRFIIAGVGEAQAYQLVDSRPRLIGKFDLDEKPISVTATNRLGEFAVFNEQGTVQILAIDSA